MGRAICAAIRGASFPVFIMLCIGFCGAGTAAASSDDSQVDGADAGAVPGQAAQQGFWSAAVVLHSFTGDEMKDAYGQMYGGFFQGGRLLSSGVGWRIETGLLLAVGDPLFLDSTWEVSSSDMEMLVVPLGGSVVYQFLKSDAGRSFMPYVGLGLEGYFGFERTSVDMTRFPEGEFEWNDTQYRYTFGGHAIFGVDIGLTDKVRGLVEIRWTQGADGSEVEHSFSEEEINEGWPAVAEAVQRPDFNFTG